MEVVELPVDEIKEWENNSRIHTKRNLDAIRTSLENFDQYKPIVVQKSSMRIIAGNGTYMAARSLGWKTIFCNIVDVDDSKAEALAIADNRTGLLSQWDEKQLTESLKNLRDSGDLNLTGFDTLELDKMLSFQDGSMFEKITPETKEKPREVSSRPEEQASKPVAAGGQPQPAEGEIRSPVDYDEQINFTICGVIFSLADRRQIEEISCLMNFLRDAPRKEREEVVKEVFDSIQGILTQKFMR